MTDDAATVTGSLHASRDRGPFWLWLIVSAILVSAFGYLRLGVYPDRFVPLTSALALVVCLWHRDLRLLWGMTTVFLGMALYKALFLIPSSEDHADRVLFPLMQSANTALVAVVIHLVIRLTDRLEDAISSLQQANAELAASNEELAAREEEITQQFEELQVQSEELEQQAEELSSQTEELHAVNSQLADRERSLGDLLELSAGGADEQAVLDTLAETIRRILGDRAAGAAILERVGDEMTIEPVFGLTPECAPLPRQKTLADLTLNRGAPASLADLGLRTDLVAPILANGEPTRSIAAAPLLLHNAPSAVLEVYGTLPGEWSARDLRVIQWLADQCGRTLTTARLTAEREHWLAAEQRARQSAESANRAKDEFVATLSHELRTPLTAILGWATLLRKTCGDASDEVRKGVEVIERNARRQGQLISDLLDISGIIAGKVALEAVDVDLGRIVEQEVESARPNAAAKGVQLICAVDDLDRALRGDPSRLQQVVWNLLSNAIKFTPRGGQVRVTAMREASFVRIEVADSGEGIAPEILPLMFERYRQGDGSVTRRHGGLGLGLTIVKTLVELHGGSIDARSDGLGKGATFSVLLPLRTARAEQSPPREAHGAAPTDRGHDAGALAGLSVLVVDDEADARDLLFHILQGRGAAVTLAASAAEALEVAKEFRPDAVISDIGMPGMDGCALIRALRDAWAGAAPLPSAIALTAFARSEERLRALDAGFERHLAKPVEPKDLIATILSLRKSVALPADRAFVQRKTS